CLRLVDIPNIIYSPQSVNLLDVSIAGIGQFLGTFDYEITLEDGLLNFELGKVNPIQAERVDALPTICDEMTPDTPENSFETFWHFFDEHYPFFEVRGM